MQFRTELKLPPAPFSISHQHRIMPLGSCFSEHMANRLKRYLFHVTPNPFGTSYNPLSLANQVNDIRQNRKYVAGDLNQQGDTYFSFDHYTAFSDADQNVVLQNINNALEKVHRSLPKTGLLMLTLGTAHAWQYQKENRIVNNCHKIPGKEFERVLLSPEKIIEKLGSALDQLLADYPELQVMLTVSPIRHLRDGAVANQRSKAILLVAAHELADKNERIHYFPSYELMMDDLRDYRFYTDDMIHPTDQAVEYIWQKFSKTILSEKSQEAVRNIEPILRFLEHRPSNIESAAHRESINRMIKVVDQEKARLPEANWGPIEKAFQQH